MTLAPYVLALACASVLAGCMSVDPPTHPLRLEGYPGAPIEPGLFPLAPGTRWTFRDKHSGAELVLALEQVPQQAPEGGAGGLVLTGRSAGLVHVRVADGFLELLHDGDVVERPLKVEGVAGDAWTGAGASYRVFGYDRLEILGQERRALVVAADRGEVRDLFWFARGLGWIRFRTERQGRVIRDAVLVAFSPGRN